MPHRTLRRGANHLFLPGKPKWPLNKKIIGALLQKQNGRNFHVDPFLHTPLIDHHGKTGSSVSHCPRIHPQPSMYASKRLSFTFESSLRVNHGHRFLLHQSFCINHCPSPPSTASECWILVCIVCLVACCVSHCHSLMD